MKGRTRDTRRQTLVRSAVLLLATLLVVALLVRSIGGAGALHAAVRRASVPWMLLAFAVAAVNVLLGALRWVLVLRAIGYRLPYRRSLEVLLSVWPLGLVTPSRANELLRAFTVRDVVPLPAGAGSVLAEKAVDVLTLLLMAGAGAGVARQWSLAGALAASAALELAVLASVMRWRRHVSALPFFRSRAAEVEAFLETFATLGRAPAAIVLVAGVSLTIRVLTVVITHALLRAVGVQLSFVLTLTLWPAATVAALLPVTMAGMGTRDAAFLFLVRQAGVSVARASLLAATMGYSAIAIWSFGLVGLPFMVREGLKRRGASGVGRAARDLREDPVTGAASERARSGQV